MYHSFFIHASVSGHLEDLTLDIWGSGHKLGSVGSVALPGPAGWLFSAEVVRILPLAGS